MRTWAKVAGLAGVVLAGAAQAVEAPSPAPVAQVMIVADFHMASPGRDIANMKVDDVLAPTRQAEIAAVTTALARFRPTVVAAEWPAKRAADRYVEYRAGGLRQSRNEVVQLGFRLAAAAGLERFVGIDADGDFPSELLEAFGKAHPDARGPADRIAAAAQSAVAEQADTLSRQGVAATLRLLNTPARIVRDHGLYRDLIRVGAGDEQPGAGLLSAWYARNLQICARLVQSLRPGDRAVVFYGAGHAFLLRQCVSETPGLQLVEANDWLPAGAK